MVDVIQFDVHRRVNLLRAQILRHMFAPRRPLFALLVSLKFLIFPTLVITLREALVDRPVLLHIYLFLALDLELLVIADVLDV